MSTDIAALRQALEASYARDHADLIAENKRLRAENAELRMALARTPVYLGEFPDLPPRPPSAAAEHTGAVECPRSGPGVHPQTSP